MVKNTPKSRATQINPCSCDCGCSHALADGRAVATPVLRWGLALTALRLWLMGRLGVATPVLRWGWVLEGGGGERAR